CHTKHPPIQRTTIKSTHAYPCIRILQHGNIEFFQVNLLPFLTLNSFILSSFLRIIPDKSTQFAEDPLMVL
ncbi:MAG: hypothetical protein II213_01595, partial [Lachnospiraceae bacterium]|nr:hypothetical protein [Lachnospiraceae bacterium]